MVRIIGHCSVDMLAGARVVFGTPEERDMKGAFQGRAREPRGQRLGESIFSVLPEAGQLASGGLRSHGRSGRGNEAEGGMLKLGWQGS